ncbi:lysophospholipid acyltransferase family protein [Pontibacter sp. JAM-7]|uniref:lysophospholipid acyltransferase family protein n=1 Tax=Pontibacter sp. JAM-7 TaxID=3366581 RepID=UPI003AF6286E
MLRQPTPLHYVRAACYYLGFYSVTVVYACICLLIAPWLPYRPRFKLITGINYFYIFWLNVCCGVKVSVEGREHLPSQGAYVVVANHQSEWETLFFQTLVRPQCAVLKRELLKIPFFGWVLAMLKPIALDRSKRREALKQLLAQGSDRLAQQIPVLIFPQGTRVPVGKVGRFNKGAAMLAVKNAVPVVPIYHNAGEYWPGKSFVKYPGTVRVVIGEPINPESLSVEAVHQQSVVWLESHLQAKPAAQSVE